MHVGMRHKHGFSVIELLVVLAIIAIASVVVVGSYSNFRKGRRIQSGAAMINTLFATARSYAISTNQHYRVVLQMRNPMTQAEEYVLWIDQVYSDVQEAPNPSLLAPAQKPKVTTPETLAQGLRIADATVNVVRPGQTATNQTMQYSTNNYAVIHFAPDGTSDGATVHLIDAESDPAVSTNYHTIKLYQPTASSKIYADVRK